MAEDIKCDLDNIYSYFDGLMEKFIANRDTYDNSGNKRDIFCFYLIDYFGKNNPPKIVSSDDFSKIPSEVLYHGFVKYDHAANFIWDHTYHYGEGIRGCGFYTTTDYDEALDYTFSCKSPLPFKIKSDSVVKLEELDFIKLALLSNTESEAIKNVLGEEKFKKYNALIDFVNQKIDGKYFLGYFTSNTSSLAAYLGFDAIIEEYKSKPCKHVIVLNRGALVVRDKDFESFMQNASDKYKVNSSNYVLDEKR